MIIADILVVKLKIAANTVFDCINFIFLVVMFFFANSQCSSLKDVTPRQFLIDEQHGRNYNFSKFQPCFERFVCMIRCYQFIGSAQVLKINFPSSNSVLKYPAAQRTAFFVFFKIAPQ